jgi:hypothetical protein
MRSVANAHEKRVESVSMKCGNRLNTPNRKRKYRFRACIHRAHTPRCSVANLPSNDALLPQYTAARPWSSCRCAAGVGRG